MIFTRLSPLPLTLDSRAIENLPSAPCTSVVGITLWADSEASAVHRGIAERAERGNGYRQKCSPFGVGLWPTGGGVKGRGVRYRSATIRIVGQG